MTSQIMDILGLPPSGDFDDVDISKFFQTQLNQKLTSSSTTLISPLVSLPSPPPSHSSSLSSPPYSQQKTLCHRRRDPDHVPRPRNSFIIFRCDYTRQHCHGNGDQESADAEKTSLSKRAGEAWKNIPADVKRHYKRLADCEREEHARRNPEYRFRPKRRRSSPLGRWSSPSKGKAESTELDAVGLHSVREDLRSRSSSLSSLGSSLSDVFSSPSSISVAPSKHHPSASRSTPSTQLPYVETSPEPLCTPLDGPTELSSGLLRQASSIYLFDDTLYGNLALSVSSESYIQRISDHPPLPVISETDTDPPLPVAMRASSLTGWNGGDIFFPPSFASSGNHAPPSTPPVPFDCGSQPLSSDPYIGLGSCGLSLSTATDITPLDPPVQKNMTSSTVGLSDCGIDLSAFSFNMTALSS